MQIKSYYTKLLNALISKDNPAKIYKEFILKFPELPENPLLKIEHLLVSYIYNASGNKNPETIKIISTVIDELYKNEKLIPKYITTFTSFIGLLTSHYTEKRDWKKVGKYFKLFRKYYEEKITFNTIEMNEIMYYWIVFKLSYYSGYVEFTRKFLEKAIKLSHKNFSPFAGILNYYIGLSFFLQKDYDKAMLLIDNAMEHIYIKKNKAISTKLKLVKLVFVYETGNYDLLPYQIVSTYRSMRRKANIFEYEKFLLRFIKNLLKIPAYDKITLQKYFKETYKTIIASEELKQSLVEDFDFVSWLRSKIEDRDLLEIHRGTATKEEIEKIIF